MLHLNERVNQEFTRHRTWDITFNTGKTERTLSIGAQEGRYVEWSCAGDPEKTGWSQKVHETYLQEDETDRILNMFKLTERIIYILVGTVWNEFVIELYEMKVEIKLKLDRN